MNRYVALEIARELTSFSTPRRKLNIWDRYDSLVYLLTLVKKHSFTAEELGVNQKSFLREVKITRSLIMRELLGFQESIPLDV